MTAVAAGTVLDVWEAGLRMTPAARSVLLLQAVGEGDVRDWSVGQRDRALLRSYCAGGALEAVADCPRCGARLELAIDAGAIPGAGRVHDVLVEVGTYRVSARPVTVGDLDLLGPCGDVGEMSALLLVRCVLSATRAGVAVEASDLPTEVVEAVESALDGADPGADLRIAMSCTDCDARWTETLDPVRFAWSAVEVSAQRLASDVLTLARGYGWSEHEILGLSAFRRRLYLSAVRP